MFLRGRAFALHIGTLELMVSYSALQQKEARGVERERERKESEWERIYTTYLQKKKTSDVLKYQCLLFYWYGTGIHYIPKKIISPFVILFGNF